MRKACFARFDRWLGDASGEWRQSISPLLSKIFQLAPTRHLPEGPTTEGDHSERWLGGRE